MNAGAYNGEIGNLVKEVCFIDESFKLSRLNANELDFGYRHCALSGRDVVIVEASLELADGSREEINQMIRDYTRAPQRASAIRISQRGQHV